MVSLLETKNRKQIIQSADVISPLSRGDMGKSLAGLSADLLFWTLGTTLSTVGKIPISAQKLISLVSEYMRIFFHRNLYS